VRRLETTIHQALGVLTLWTSGCGDPQTDDPMSAASTGLAAESSGASTSTDTTSATGDPEGESGRDNDSDSGSDSGGAELPAAACDPDVIPLEGDTFFPDGIAATADGSTLYVGSVLSNVIVAITPSACATPSDTHTVVEFAVQDDDAAGAYLGLYLDEVAGLLWACDADAEAGLFASIDAFSILDGTRVHNHPIPIAATGPNTFCNDLTVDSAGNVYATDPYGGQLLRVPVGAPVDSQAEVWSGDERFAVPRGDFGLSGIDYDPASNAIYTVKFSTGTLYRIAIDATTGAAGAITDLLDASSLPAFEEGDGVEVIATNDVLVVRGGNTSVLTRAVIETDQVAMIRTVQLGLDGPTAAAYVGDEEAWVVMGQLGRLGGNPRLPFTIERLSIAD